MGVEGEDELDAVSGEERLGEEGRSVKGREIFVEVDCRQDRQQKKVSSDSRSV